MLLTSAPGLRWDRRGSCFTRDNLISDIIRRLANTNKYRRNATLCPNQWPQHPGHDSRLISLMAGGSEMWFSSFSLLFHVHLSQPLQSSERSGGGHVAWRPGPILSPVFQIMDGHNCHINIARPGVAATSQFSSRGLTHARHLGKEPRRSLRRSVQGMWDVRQPGSRGTRHCPGDRSQLSQDPGPAAGSQVAGPGQTSARHRHGRMPAKICRQQLS